MKVTHIEATWCDNHGQMRVQKAVYVALPVIHEVQVSIKPPAKFQLCMTCFKEMSKQGKIR